MHHFLGQTVQLKYIVYLLNEIFPEWSFFDLGNLYDGHCDWLCKTKNKAHIILHEY